MGAVSPTLVTIHAIEFEIDKHGMAEQSLLKIFSNLYSVQVPE